MKSILFLLCFYNGSHAFIQYGLNANHYMRSNKIKSYHENENHFLVSPLFSTPPKRVARRDLKKRTRRKRDGQTRAISNESSGSSADKNIVQIETRPLVRSKSIEAGEDYWIDEADLQKYTQREQAIKNRKAMEGEISKEKLQQEVVAPYKQNWIGLLSASIVVLAAILKENPELLNTPTIPIPDL